MIRQLCILLLTTMKFTVHTSDSIPILLPYHANVTRKLGSSVELVCPIELQSANGLPNAHSMAGQSMSAAVANQNTGIKALMISWTVRNIDENLIATDRRYSFINASRVVRIKDLKISDAGEYKCRGVTGFGSQEAVFYVNILENDSCQNIDLPDTLRRPCFRNHGMQTSKNKIKTIHRSVGSSVVFHCDAAGNPAPKYLWLYENSIVDWRKTVDDVRRPYLQIDDLQREYKGHYTCQVSNSLGKISFTFALVVKDSPSALPRIVEDMENLTLPVGASAELVGKVQCKCVPIIQWLQRVQPNNRDSPLTVSGSGKTRRPLIALPKAASSETGESFMILDLDQQQQQRSSHQRPQPSAGRSSIGDNNGADVRIESSRVGGTVAGETVIVSRLQFRSLRPWHSGKYALLTMSQQKANVHEISYRTVFLTVVPERVSSSLNSKAASSPPKIIIYISVPMGILVLCVFLVFYCLVRRKNTPSAHSLIGSSSSNHHNHGNIMKVKAAAAAGYLVEPPHPNVAAVPPPPASSSSSQQQHHNHDNHFYHNNRLPSNSNQASLLYGTPGLHTLTSSMHSTITPQPPQLPQSQSQQQQQQQHYLQHTSTPTVPPAPSSNSSISLHKLHHHHGHQHHQSQQQQQPQSHTNSTSPAQSVSLINQQQQQQPPHYSYYHNPPPHTDLLSTRDMRHGSSSNSSSNHNCGGSGSGNSHHFIPVVSEQHQHFSHPQSQHNQTAPGPPQFQLPPSLCFDTDAVSASSSFQQQQHPQQYSQQQQHHQHQQQQLHHNSYQSSAPYFPGHNSSSSASLTYS